jgi:flagellar FliL protein
MAAESFDDVGGGARGAGHKKLSGKRLLLFVVLPLLLLVGGVAFLYFSKALDPIMQMVGIGGGGAEKPVAARLERGAEPIYHALPDMLVNLKTDGPRPVFLKLKVMLHVNKQEDVERIKQLQPRIIDAFQIYLREQKPEQLAGSAGPIKLREELLIRINQQIKPAEVKDVLFGELLVQ